MSFSSQVKAELTAVSVLKKHCRRAELAGIIYSASTLSITGKGIGLSVSTENMSVVKRTISLLEKLFEVSAELSAVEQLPKKTQTYIVTVSKSREAMSVLEGLGLKLGAGIEPDESVFREMLLRECCKKAFLRGAFLGGGSMSDPNKVYHLEIVMGSQQLADAAVKILRELGMNAKYTQRKESFVIYIKEIEQIVEFLTHTGAYSAILELENIRILKEINNNINRAYNCESANIDRTIESAGEQIKCIKIIAEHIGLESLSASLRQAAELRLANPLASLSELAAIEPAVSRSAINHRMRKLKEIAYSIENKEEM